MRLAPEEFDAVEENRALLRAVDAIQAVEDRCLACTVRPDDGEELAVVYTEGHAVECLDPSKCEVDILEVEQDVSQSSPPSS
jgi:hypothetical protein